MNTASFKNELPDPLAQPDWKYRFELTFLDVLQLFLYVGTITILSIEGLRHFHEYWRERYMMVSLAVIGIWRYSWWMTHFFRALIYKFFMYPGIRRQADYVWEQGWRPKKLVFLICSYKEDPDITEKVCQGLIRSIRQIGVHAEIFVSGTAADEEQYITMMRQYAPEDDIKLIFVRQTIPDKRIAVGQLLRAISRREPDPEDPVVFMDGDTIIAPGCLRRCLPIFYLFPKVKAVTTNEKAIIKNNRFFQKWFDLRLAQRHLQFQSLALSKKVLTLTGRLSIFKAENVVKESFISTVENDSISHWLWGTFRFLSGDDKSSWYALIREGAQMLYVPDAMVYTVDQVKGNTLLRIWQNIIRWSGNSLRNSGRVIQMGPWKVGLFTWWCLIDQRLSTWTCLSGPVAIIAVALFRSPYSSLAFLLWLFISRFCFSFILFFYNGRIDMTFPFILYFNQIMTAFGKMYILFRLPLQRWSNRSSSVVDPGGFNGLFKKAMAMYLTILYLVMLILFVAVYAKLVSLPDWESIRQLIM